MNAHQMVVGAINEAREVLRRHEERGLLDGELVKVTPACLQLLVACAATPPIEYLRTSLAEVPVTAYRLREGRDGYEREVLLENRGPNSWAITMAGSCLNREGEWEYEPMPSWRSDEFKARTRFWSAEKAFDFWQSCAGKEGI